MEGTNNMPIFSEGYKTKIILFLRVSRNNFLKESGKKTSSIGGGGGGDIKWNGPHITGE